MGSSTSKGPTSFGQWGSGQWQNEFTDLGDADFLSKLNKEIGSMPNGNRRSKVLEIVFNLGKDEQQPEEMTTLSFMILANANDEKKCKKLISKLFVQERLLNSLKSNTDRLSTEDMLDALKRIVTDDDISYVIAQSMLEWLLDVTRADENAEVQTMVNEIVIALSLTNDNFNKFSSILEDSETLSKRQLFKQIFRILAKQTKRHLYQKPHDPQKNQSQSQKFQNQGRKVAETREARRKTKNQVMISYSWQNQEVAIALESVLASHGVKTWMNRRNHKLELIEEIAEAVENSSHVLALVSSHYKQSVYCKMEAKYAIELQKPIIPIHVEEGFTPSGWIGKIISGSSSYKFYHQNDVTSDKCRPLIRSLTTPPDNRNQASSVCALI